MHRGQGVRVVRRADDDRVDLLADLVEHLAVVGEERRPSGTVRAPSPTTSSSTSHSATMFSWATPARFAAPRSLTPITATLSFSPGLGTRANIGAGEGRRGRGREELAASQTGHRDGSVIVKETSGQSNAIRSAKKTRRGLGVPPAGAWAIGRQLLGARRTGRISPRGTHSIGDTNRANVLGESGDTIVYGRGMKARGRRALLTPDRAPWATEELDRLLSFVGWAVPGLVCG